MKRKAILKGSYNTGAKEMSICFNDTASTCTLFEITIIISN